MWRYLGICRAIQFPSTSRTGANIWCATTAGTATAAGGTKDNSAGGDAVGTDPL